MEQHKFENYYGENSEPLKLWTLDSAISQFIRSSLVSILDTNIKNERFIPRVYDNLTIKTNVNEINEEIGFKNILKTIGNYSFSDEDQFFLIWDSTSNIDVCTVETLKKFWDYIWYGPADESLILFIPDKIILLVNDWGELGIKYVKSENTKQ